MNRFPHEPLSEEEQALARLTGRLGPHGEPSHALDARILAAAHAAVAVDPVRRRRSRWPAAMGVAASLVLAVGVAWQLRPLHQTTLSSEVPAVTSRDRQAPVNDAAVPAGAQASQALVEAGPTPAEVLPSGPATADKAAAAPRVAPAPQAVRSRTPADPASATPAAPRAMDAYAPPPPPPPAPPAPSPAQATAPAMDSARAFPADSAGVSAESGNRDSPRTLASQAEMARTEAKQQDDLASEAHRSERVEVTGSRLQRTDLQVPVMDDAQLPVAQWLERIRTRYGLGDTEAARQSLQGFILEHPRHPIPDDLKPLLDP